MRTFLLLSVVKILVVPIHKGRHLTLNLCENSVASRIHDQSSLHLLLNCVLLIPFILSVNKRLDSQGYDFSNSHV